MKLSENTYIYDIITIICITGIFIGICCYEYRGSINTYNDTQLNLSTEYINIRNLEAKELELEDELYNLMNEYYDNIKDDPNKELISRMFDKCFPTMEVYNDARKASFVSMYALIEMYPEIIDYKNISSILEDISGTIMQIDNTVDERNALLNLLNADITNVNNTLLAKMFKGFRLDKIEVAYATIE